MKKFKIKEQEIFANSLHDALAIYRHKVKDGRYIRFSGKSKSAQGYEIKGYCMTSEGRMYAVIYRPNVGDYLVAAGYNQQRGDWDQGYYDFKTEEQARKKAEQLTKMYDSVSDSKVKDYQKADVQKIADYLWSWSNNDPFGWEARYIIEEGLNESNLTEANLQKGIKNAEKELDRVYAQLKQRVQQMLEAGYKGQKERIYKYADVLRKEDAYQK